MSGDAPTLIGRHRVGGRAANLGQAVPVGRRPFEDPPVEKTEPKSSDELRADEAARRDAQPVLTLCGLCEDFRFEGPAGEGRELARAHREAEHPQACVRRARGARRITRRAGRSEEANAQIKFEADEARRVRAEREDAERLVKVERGRQRDALAAKGQRVASHG